MKQVASCLLISLLITYVLATCVNDCNSHGSCVGGICQCQTGYAGSDCSIWDHVIYSGIEQTGHLNTFQWRYYHFTTTSDLSTFTVYVNQTSAIGDIDLYVGENFYPDVTHSNFSDTSTDDRLSYTHQVDGVSTWYFGLYGYWTSDYSIVLFSSLRGCTIDCGANGHCEGSSCVCDEPYVGADCSIYDNEIVSGVVQSNYVQTQQWKYYHFQGIPGQTVDIVVSQANSSYDIDLYLKKVDRPTTWRFDVYNGTVSPVTYMHISNVTSDLYEIGIYGYRGGSYDILFTQYLDDPSICINDCSDHGTCTSHTCSCDSDFSGPICETYTENMEFDVVYNGKVESSFWNYFHIHYFSESSIRLDLHQTSDGDCDIYIRSTTPPTSTIYQMANLSESQDTSVLIHEPGDLTWYIGVFGWLSCSYTLSAVQIAECQCEEGISHGSCVGSSVECVCEIGYTGPTCTIETTQITSGQVISLQSITPNNWAFYYFSSSSTAVIITLVETSSSGKLMLIASLEGYPSGENYEYYDIGPSNFHEIHIVWGNPYHRDYYCGVTTSTVTMNSDPIVYSITAYGTAL